MQSVGRGYNSESLIARIGVAVLLPLPRFSLRNSVYGIGHANVGILGVDILDASLLQPAVNVRVGGHVNKGIRRVHEPHCFR